MKTKQIFIILLGVIFSMAVAAQGGPENGTGNGPKHGKGKKEMKTPEEKAKKQTEWMTKELGLTAEQAAKVEAINLKTMKTNQAIKEEAKAKHKANKEAKEAELKKVLTPEQYAKFEEIRKAKQAERDAKKAERKAKMKEFRQAQKAAEQN